jgi:hypothetical protein
MAMTIKPGVLGKESRAAQFTAQSEHQTVEGQVEVRPNSDVRAANTVTRSLPSSARF